VAGCLVIQQKMEFNCLASEFIVTKIPPKRTSIVVVKM
jgi:hypothetical protein